MHAMTAVSQQRQPAQNDRKSVVLCKRPARMELFRDTVFCGGQITPSLTPSKSHFFDLTSQARGVCPLPNEPAILCKRTVCWEVAGTDEPISGTRAAFVLYCSCTVLCDAGFRAVPVAQVKIRSGIFLLVGGLASCV